MKINSSKKILLFGQPNVGKSSIFNALSSKYTIVSNYPGTTVSISELETEFGIIVDSPGIYDFSEQDSDDVEVTKRLLRTADIVVNVINARTIARFATDITAHANEFAYDFSYKSNR